MEKKIKIDLEIYNKLAIEEAIVDFQDYGKIELLDSELKLKWVDSNEIEELFNEFMNYVISLEC